MIKTTDQYNSLSRTEAIDFLNKSNFTRKEKRNDIRRMADAKQRNERKGN